MDVAESDANEKAFGRPGSTRGQSAYPQVRVAGSSRTGRTFSLVRRWTVTGSARRRWRGASWGSCEGTCCAWRIATSSVFLCGNRHLRQKRSWSGEPSTSSSSPRQGSLQTVRTSGSCTSRPSTAVRIETASWCASSITASTGFRENYRLVTNILDPAMAPAFELARLYSERWTIETAVDELKTHLRGSNVVLRSKLPELVRQTYSACCWRTTVSDRLCTTPRSPKGSRLTNSRSCTRSEWCTESFPGSFLSPSGAQLCLRAHASGDA